MRRVHHGNEPSLHLRSLVVSRKILEELRAYVVVAHGACHLDAGVHERLERLGGDGVVCCLAERQRDVAQAQDVRRRTRHCQYLADKRLRGGRLVRIVAHRLVLLPRERQPHVDIRNQPDRFRIERTRRRRFSLCRGATRADRGESRRSAEKAPASDHDLFADVFHAQEVITHPVRSQSPSACWRGA